MGWLLSRGGARYWYRLVAICCYCYCAPSQTAESIGRAAPRSALAGLPMTQGLAAVGGEEQLLPLPEALAHGRYGWYDTVPARGSTNRRRRKRPSRPTLGAYLTNDNSSGSDSINQHHRETLRVRVSSLAPTSWPWPQRLASPRRRWSCSRGNGT